MATESTSVLEKFPSYEAVIGIEVHVQLTTKTKIFCSCPNQISKEPNSNICQICAGYPGVLPVLNQAVLDYAIMAGLATNCAIASTSQFDRKHYFYPDLPKGYQITQQAYPICTNGFVPIRLANGQGKQIRLIRIHIEEDAGKNVHTDSGESFVDLNRAGTPLLEIVSHPDIASAEEAKTYLKTLRAIVQYLGICSGNMEEGAFRADTNVSVRKKGASKFGTRVELKNINSFKFIGDAAEHEIERQIMLLENGGTVKQETRLWDTKNRVTIAMRSKEEMADYRYFQEADLPLVHIDKSWIERIRGSMPELPERKFERLCKEKGLSPYEAEIIIEDKALATYFEQATRHSSSKNIINWILRDLMNYVKEAKVDIGACKVTPEKLAQLVALVDSGSINNQAAKQVFNEIAKSGKSPQDIVKELGLEQIGSTDVLEELVKKVIAENPAAVQEYKAGKEKLFSFFVGQAMAKAQGKGNPQVIQELVKKYLK